MATKPVDEFMREREHDLSPHERLDQSCESDLQRAREREELADDLARFYDDALGYVMYVFPLPE